MRKVRSHWRTSKSGKSFQVREHQRKEAIKLIRKTQPIIDDVTSTPKEKKLARETQKFARQFL